jgi:hypothetical protein
VAEITIARPIEVLTKEVNEHLPADEIQEVYNEWFPRGDVGRTDASPEATKRRIEQFVAYLHGDRYEDEITELWKLIFIKHRDVWYNEEDEVLNYEAKPTPYSTVWEPEMERSVGGP